MDPIEEPEHPGLQTIENLITLHAKNSTGKDREADDANIESSRIIDTGKTLIFARMVVECEKGLHISIDDDFTADYDEYMIGLEAKEFSM